jgi:GH24 family phage-related lysozyme (muramidase)
MKLWNKITAMFLAGIMPLMANDPNAVTSNGLSLDLSRKALDLIIYYEVGGKASYNKSYTKPIVPAWQTTASGVTVGFGNDLGHMTKDQIRTAFEGVATEEEIKLMQSVSGMKGKNAYYNGLPKVKYKVSFTYDEAEKVFLKYTLPSFTKQTSNAFGLFKGRLHPHSNGALVSIVFNRGASMANTDSRKEMRWIKHNIATGQDKKIPGDIRSMKRLWSYTKLKGLHLRRDAEAKLFQEGLDTKN